TSDSCGGGDWKSGLAGGQMSADDALRLFDGMPPGSEDESAPLMSATDRIGALPDHILHHLLSFLPAQAAVRTCVLARRWRHLWRSTTGLRIVGLDDEEPVQVQDLRKFMDHLLVLRERTDLDTVQIKFDLFNQDDEPYVNLWTRFAVICKVQVLTLRIHDELEYLDLDDLPLVSRHLRTLNLHGVSLRRTFVDFASCTALANLKIDDCFINFNKISSCSLKHLSITSCQSDLDCRVRISAPGLVSLELEDFIGITPLLEDMASLEAACVDLSVECKDVCLNYGSGVFCGANDNTCKNCVPGSDDCSSDCLLLGGISSAKHLKLISDTGKFIFTRDLKHCPTFSKLKTLLLNKYWCVAPDLDPLSCILTNSPVLEKLTLELFPKGQNPKLEIKGSYCCMERPSAISEHLDIVEVKCDVIDEIIRKVLKFLCALNIRFSFE
uniref:F-box domain-containing protein n=3 Tax=Aegilops tauschii subsp. strangulata TaxID=200361 RepID=A0A453N125_AEGTS